MATMASHKIDSLYSLFKGEAGLRKSGCAVSYPKPYFFDWDMKMDALHIPMQNWGINPVDVEYDTYKDWDSARQKLEQLQVNCKYKTLVFDSITSMADASIRQTTKSKGAGGKRIGTIAVSGFDEYNAEAAAIAELIALTKDIKNFHNVNIILIGHIIQKEMKSPDGQTHMSRILVTAGKNIAQKIPAYCSEIYHFNIKTGMVAGANMQYTIKTNHTGDDFARSSIGLANEIVFNDDQLYQKWIAPAIAKINEKQVPVVKF